MTFKVGDRVRTQDGEGKVTGEVVDADTGETIYLVQVPGENDWYFSESELSLIDRPLKNFEGDEATLMKPKTPIFEQNVRRITSQIADLLIEKNAAYGDSALNPIRVFSKSDRIEQLNVRIDDKISRMQRGSEYRDEDTEMDLIGYLVLRKIARESE